MSNMEKFIHENREEFDHLEPSEKIWEQIESGMNKKKPAGQGGFYADFKVECCSSSGVSSWTYFYIYFKQER